MELRTERLVMRPLDRDTIRSIYDGIVDGPALRGFEVPDDWPMEGLRSALPVMFNDLMDAPSSLGWHAWVIADGATMMIMGDAGFKGPPNDEGVVEIGFSMLPLHRGNGFAKEAVRALMDHAFTTGRVRTIVAECEEDNVISRRTLLATGFEKRRTVRGRDYFERRSH